MTTLGQYTLTISLILYLTYFIPQIIYNQLWKKTSSISPLTHYGMYLATCLDLLYGLGYGLQWQYVLVSIIALLFLIIQQWQILVQSKYKSYMSSIGITITGFIVLIIAFNHFIPEKILYVFGWFNAFLYAAYWAPQLYCNYVNKNTAGFTIIFIIMNAVALLCDLISAFMLGWPLPSVISPVIILCLVIALIFQYAIYRNNYND